MKEFDKDVYSNVPFHRTEYVAESITAYFNLDLALLAGYGLPEEAQNLLTSLALFKIQKFLKSGLRLRTACELRAKELKVKEPQEIILPNENDSLKAAQEFIKICSQKGLFADPPVTKLKNNTIYKEDKEENKE